MDMFLFYAHFNNYLYSHLDEQYHSLFDTAEHIRII